MLTDTTKDEFAEIKKEIAWHRERIASLKEKLENLTPLENYYCRKCKKTYSKDECGYRKWNSSYRRVNDEYCWCDRYIEDKLCCPDCGYNFKYTLNRILTGSTIKKLLSQFKSLENPYCYPVSPIIIYEQ